MNQKEEATALFQYLSRGKKLKILPGSETGGADIMVCVSHAVDGIKNYESTCARCHKPIWFADNNHPGMEKICITCFLKFSKVHPSETVGNVDSICKALMVGKRN